MKDLPGYIKISQDELYLHLAIEYNLKYLNESRSIPKGLENVANLVIDKLKNNNLKSLNLKIATNEDFCRNLIIYIKFKTTGNSEGETKLENCNKDNAEFGLILNKTNIDWIDIKSTIMHELMHIYQNYKCLLNNKSLITAFNKKGYDKYSDFEDISKDKDFIKSIFYYIDKDEIPAFIQQYITLLEKENPQCASDAFDIISKTEYYVLLKGLYDNADNLDKIFPDIENIYKDIFRDCQLTKSQILSKLSKVIKKSYKRFLTKISKACIEKNSFTTGRSNREFMKKIIERLNEHGGKIS